MHLHRTQSVLLAAMLMSPVIFVKTPYVEKCLLQDLPYFMNVFSMVKIY